MNPSFPAETVPELIDGICRRCHKKSVAVWKRPHDRLGGEVCAGAGLIFDDKLLSKPFRRTGRAG